MGCAANGAARLSPPARKRIPSFLEFFARPVHGGAAPNATADSARLALFGDQAPASPSNQQAGRSPAGARAAEPGLPKE